METWEDVIKDIIKDSRVTYNRLSEEGKKIKREEYRDRLYNAIKDKSTNVPGATVTAFYSGPVYHEQGSSKAQDIAKDFAAQTNKKLRIIDDTKLGEFLEEKTEEIQEAFGKNNKDDAVKLLYGDNSEEYRNSSDTRIVLEKGLWDRASEKFAAETNTPKVISISPNAQYSRTFSRTEIEELLNNEEVKSINGIDRTELKSFYDTSSLEVKRYVGGSEFTNYERVNFLLTAQSSIDLDGSLIYYEYDTDKSTGKNGEREKKTAFIFDLYTKKLGIDEDLDLKAFENFNTDVVNLKSSEELDNNIKALIRLQHSEISAYSIYNILDEFNHLKRPNFHEPKGIELGNSETYRSINYDGWASGINDLNKILGKAGVAGTFVAAAFATIDAVSLYLEGDEKAAADILTNFVSSELSSITGSTVGYLLALGVVAAAPVTVPASVGLATAFVFSTVGGMIGEELLGDDIEAALESFGRGIYEATGYAARELIEGLESLTSEVFKSLRERFVEASTIVSPLVLIDPSGERAAASDEVPVLADISLEESGIEYNLYGSSENPILVPTGWIDPNEAFLVLDRNNNSKIDSLLELFGSVSHADGGVSPNGIATLAEYNSNKDFTIDSKDEVFKSLQLWQDLNQDGVSQDSELFSLADFGIASISVLNQGEYSLRETTPAGNIISHSNSYTRTDGTKGEIVDVWFQTDATSAKYTKDYKLDPEVATLPVYTGVSLLPSLPRAASDNPQLKTQLQELASIVPTTGAEVLALNEAADNLLYLWAGVENIASDSRGEHIDARKIGFLEAFFGSPLNDRNGNLENIGSRRAEAMEELYVDVRNQLVLRLTAQSDFLGSILPEGGYDLFSDQFNLNEQDYERVLQGLAERAPKDSNDNWNYWKQLGTLVIDLGLEVKTADGKPLEIDSLDDLFLSYTRGLNISDLNLKNYVAVADADDLTAVQKDGKGALIYGRAEDGDGILTVGTSSTDDTFLYDKSNGSVNLDFGFRSDSYDRLVLGRGITPDTISITTEKDIYSDLAIEIDAESKVTLSESSSLKYTINDGKLVNRYEVDEIYFSETNEKWNVSQLIDAYVQQQATSKDDTVYGTYFADTLKGGSGDDTLLGDASSDTYIYEVGNDVIDEDPQVYSGSFYDILELPESLALEDIEVKQLNSKDVELTFGNQPGSITLKNQVTPQYLYRKSGIHNEGIEEIRTVDNDVLYWNDIDAILDGYEVTDGNDSLVGDGKPNKLYGGDGSDTLSGAGSIDIYSFRLSNSINHDVIQDNSNDVSDKLYIHGEVTLENITVSLDSLTSGDLKLSIDDNNHILLSEQLAGNYSGIEDIYFDNGTSIDNDGFAKMTAALNPALSSEAQNALLTTIFHDNVV